MAASWDSDSRQGLETGAVRTVEGAGGRRIQLRGECDLHISAEVRSAVRSELDAGARRVIFDLSAATFLDSSVLSVFLIARRGLYERYDSGEVVLLCREGFIARLLHLLEMEQIFRICTPDEWYEHVRSMQ